MSNLKNVRAELEKMRKEMAAKEAELRREEARPVIELVNNELMNSEDVLEKFAGYSKFFKNISYMEIATAIMSM